MFFDRHNQKNSSEKEASGDITCTSCFGNNNHCECNRGYPGPTGPTGPRGCPGVPPHFEKNHSKFHAGLRQKASRGI